MNRTTLRTTLTASEFKLAQARLGLNNEGMAKAMDVSLSSIVKWRAGENISLVVSMAVRYLMEHTARDIK